MKLQPYPVYKDSGVPWLGEVPEHWEVRRGKWLFRHKKQLNADGTNSNVLSLTLRGVVNNDPENPEGLVPNDYATYQLFRKGDLVFKLIDLENLRTSRVGLVHEDGIMSSAYVRLIPQSIVNIQFFFQQYFDFYQRGIYNQLGAGVRSTLGPTDLLDLCVTIPPLPEQAAIVRFLDYADWRIRRYILAKQKMIKLLEEQKQAIIHRAVTRGLDPNVRLKPSGVEWLGDVPEHWEVKKLKHLLQINGLIRGPFGSALRAQYFVSKGYKVYEQKNAIYDDCTLGNSFIDEKKFLELKRFSVMSGDIIMSCSGTIGRVSIIPDTFEQGVINQALLIMRLNEDVHKPFFEHLFRSDGIQNSVSDKSQGSAMKNLVGMPIFKNIAIALPTLDEQIRIADYLTENKNRVTELTGVLKGQIELLKEYKVALIANLITGKLDVREAAAQLPEEAEESEVILEEDDSINDEGEELDDLEEVLEEVEV